MKSKLTYQKAGILEILRANAADHDHEYGEAVDGWRDEVRIQLKARLEALEHGEDVNLFFDLPEPEDHSKDYERAIRQLELCTECNLELEDHEFQCYVMNEWAWSERFATISSAYVK